MDQGRIAVRAADPLIRRVLLILWTMSLFSLNFISFMPAHAQQHLGIGAKTTGYGILYALFGLGAAAGAVSVGSWLAHLDTALGWHDRQRSYAVLRGVLHAIRDRLPPQEAVDLSAQFPMLVRGFYFEGWRDRKSTRLNSSHT